MTRARPARTGARPGSGTAAAGAAAALVAVLLVLVTWVAATGPDDLVRGDGPATSPREVVTDTPTPTEGPSALGRDERDVLPDAPEGGSLLGVVVLTLGVLALLGLGVLGLRWLVLRVRRWLEEREPSEPDPDEVELAVLTPAQAAEALTREAGAVRRRLGQGSPRNAIVECWARFEETAGRAGLQPRDWETAAELVLRFFDALDADTTAVQQLAALYREARFSDHEVGEAERRAAGDALEAITRSLHGVAP